MHDDEWSFGANLERGHLPTGESLETLYGAGPWSEESRPDCPAVVQCHVCGGRAYDLGDEIDCENCGVIPAQEPGATLGVPCEVYSRVVGYLRPVQNWHEGKQQEFGERKVFRVPAAALAAKESDENKTG